MNDAILACETKWPYRQGKPSKYSQISQQNKRKNKQTTNKRERTAASFGKNSREFSQKIVGTVKSYLKTTPIKEHFIIMITCSRTSFPRWYYNCNSVMRLSYVLTKDDVVRHLMTSANEESPFLMKHKLIPCQTHDLKDFGLSRTSTNATHM